MARERYYAQEAREILGYQSAEAFEQALENSHVPPADGEDEELGPFWFIESLGRDETLSLGEIAKLAGVNRATPQKWHRSPTGKAARGYEKATPHPMRSVAEAMGVPAPEADEARPRYPRRVVVGFLKAIGYMDARGQLVEEIQNKGPGRWVPVKPTIDPHPVKDAEALDPKTKKPLTVDPLTRGRLRHYAPHASAVLGYKDVGVFEQSLNKGRVPKADGYDELQRPYWWLETLEGHKADAADRKEKRQAGPEPDGYTTEGQPFRLLPEDNYYAKKAAEPAASEAKNDAE
ncbi:hypothetical protein [Streptomyces sp. NBC_01264]|uniref:hypothetical protein n=1 Tax=Streptomyces sp. NBC_01264 TaxID=2903804 RepID=UPI00225BAB07|nr:hypothetical protein [Streptomyces sp. NBC_01264]MCX4784046.1 hypothetical protein [Streptomyces sp. NBC_01264]